MRYWRESDHARAMEPANDKTVLGDFNNTTFTYAGITSTFTTRDGKFYARTDGPDGQLHDYEVAYTFGYRPLQQYLIAFPGGRYQSLGIAWDTRRKDAGGQRWFHLYPDQKITAGIRCTGPGRTRTGTTCARTATRRTFNATSTSPRTPTRRRGRR